MSSRVAGAKRDCRPRSSIAESVPGEPPVKRAPATMAGCQLPDPDDLLTDLDPAQREAVTITSGPLCILAGAGSGKTRVISRRVAYALATGVVRPRDVLVVTFTDKAAGEMAGRLAALGHRGVAASTFHAAALRQLRHFWPRVHGVGSAGDPRLEGADPGAAGGRPAGRLSLSRRPRPRRGDRMGEGAADRPGEYEARAIDDDRDAPLPPDLMAGLYRRYEAAKTRAGRIDFEDMLELTIGLIDGDPAIAAEVRDRYRWFSVDEYQDTNPLQAALLDAWLGGRDDLAVVGDEDQTIYTFTGATSDYLIGFAERFPGARVVTARDELPLDAGGPRPRQPGPRGGPDARSTSDGPATTPRPPKRLFPSLPPVRRRRSAGSRRDEAELAGVTAADPGAGARPARPMARWRSSSGPTPSCPPSRARSVRAGIPFHVRGERFFARPEVRRAVRVAEALGTGRER